MPFVWQNWTPGKKLPFLTNDEASAVQALPKFWPRVVTVPFSDPRSQGFPEELLNSLTNSSSHYLDGALYVAESIDYKIKKEINCNECIGLIIQCDWSLKNDNLVKHPNLNDFKFDVEQDFAQKINRVKLSKPTTVLFSILFQ